MKFPIPFKQSLNSGSKKLQELLLHYKNKVLIFLRFMFTNCPAMMSQNCSIDHLHVDVILLQPKSFRGLLSCVNQTLCYINLAGATKFEYERKNEKDSGRSSKMTPLCKWPIKMPFTNQALRSLFHMQNISCGGSGNFLESFWVLK